MFVQKLGSDDARLDAPEWTQAIKDLLPETEKPNVIVVMLVSSLRRQAFRRLDAPEWTQAIPVPERRLEPNRSRVAVDYHLAWFNVRRHQNKLGTPLATAGPADRAGASK